ncbi:MAG: galactose-1-phosphate uridylyltransferase, partial [Candidatus Dormiibacterota bacterium]
MTWHSARSTRPGRSARVPELRRDPVSGRWVCLAPGRAARPETPHGREMRRFQAPGFECPFCPGHEAMTPPEVEAVRGPGGKPDGPGWSVRVVPNLFPAFTAEGAEARLDDPMHQVVPALGTSEVIIHSPDHRRWLPYLPAEQASLVMVTTWRRYLSNAVPHMATVVPLYNHGPGAGASLDHPHGQLFAASQPGPELEIETAGAKRAFRDVKGCVFCHMVAVEEAAGVRVITSDEQFVAIAPWASRGPFECWIIPRDHRADFGLVSEPGAGELGGFLRAVLWRIARELDDPDLNWYIHSLPHAGGEDAVAYHWHLEIRPRVAEIAGFE